MNALRKVRVGAFIFMDSSFFMREGELFVVINNNGDVLCSSGIFTTIIAGAEVYFRSEILTWLRKNNVNLFHQSGEWIGAVLLL